MPYRARLALLFVGFCPSVARAMCPPGVEELQAPESLELARELLAGAERIEWEGRIGEAVCWSQRALEIRRRLLPEGHTDLGTAIGRLGYLRRLAGEYDDALPLLEELLAHRARYLGRDHVYYITALVLLADYHHELGSFDRAEPLFREAIDIRERTGRDEEMDYAWPLNNLGRMYLDMGRYDEAERLFQRSIEIWQAYATTARRMAAVGLGKRNLGDLYLARRRWDDAARLLGEAVPLLREGFGDHHWHVARCQQLLARAYVEQGALDDAESLAREAVSSFEESLGPDHSSVAEALGELAMILRRQGRHESAAPLLKRALLLSDASLGPLHPKAAFLLNESTLVSAARGRHDLALQSQRRYEAVVEVSLRGNLAVADEARRLAYASVFSHGSDTVYSLHLLSQPSDPSAGELALTTLLRRKARVLELSGQTYGSLRRSLPLAHRHLLDDITNARAEYAAIARRRHGPGEQEGLAQLQALELEIDELWRELARHSARAREIAEPITIAQVQRALPDDAVLVEFVRYQAVLGDDPSRDHYAAYIVERERIDWIDLGLAEDIDALAEDVRKAIMTKRSLEASRALHDRIIHPVAMRLSGSPRSLFISPDGELIRIPFEALIDESSRYLIERFTIHYLATGRDLLRPWASDPVANGPVVVVANPAGAHLPGTEREAELLRGLFEGTVVLLREEATVARLRAVSRPNQLHMATHGFFDTVAPRLRPLAPGPSIDTTPRLQTVPALDIDNPMLHTGLVLADVERGEGEPAVDDGKLTAFEISSWDLRGTQLATLSACGTGDGTLQHGEGVLGLRRAFAIAGAQTLVTSLWDVPDGSTAVLMRGYYERLTQGEGRSEAMRNAKLEMLRGLETRHPRDWAGFVVEGEWGPLQGAGPSVDPVTAPLPRGCYTSHGAGAGAHASLLMVLVGLRARRRR